MTASVPADTSVALIPAELTRYRSEQLHPKQYALLHRAARQLLNSSEQQPGRQHHQQRGWVEVTEALIERHIRPKALGQVLISDLPAGEGEVAQLHQQEPAEKTCGGIGRDQSRQKRLSAFTACKAGCRVVEPGQLAPLPSLESPDICLPLQRDVNRVQARE